MKKPQNHDQHARFLETARALGCDEDEAAFDEKLKAITRSKPSCKTDRTVENDGTEPKD